MNPRPMKILVVDDFELGRERIRIALREMGFDDEWIEDAEDGTDALSSLRAAATALAPFELIFSDWNMPQMSGLELLKQCRADAQLKNVLFVMVTSEAEQPNVIEALRSGANDYLTKPITNDTFAAKVRKLLR